MLVVLAGVLMGVLAAGEVSLSVAPQVSCVSAAKLSERVGAAGLSVVPAPSRRLAVAVTERADRLIVRGVRVGATFERTIPLEANACDAVERALVVLIVSWSRQLPVSTPVARGRSPGPSLDAVVVSEPRSPPDAPLEDPEQSAAAAAPEPQAEEPALAALASPAEARTTPLLAEVEAPRANATAPVANSNGPQVVLDVGLLGGGAFGPTPAVVGQGQLQVGIGVRRLGALLEVGLQTMRTGVVHQVSVEASTQWASLSARVRFVPAERLELELALGGRAWRIAAASTTPAASTEIFGFGGVVAAGASVRLVGPLALHARWYGSLRSQIDRFLLPGIGPVLELQPWETGLLLGLEVRAVGFREAPGR